MAEKKAPVMVSLTRPGKEGAKAVTRKFEIQHATRVLRRANTWKLDDKGYKFDGTDISKA